MYDLHAAVKLNRKRLEKQFHDADRKKHQWLIECRDLGDAYEEDAGVYFVVCETEETVNQMITDMTDDNIYERVLGIFDLRRPLEEQGVGLTRAEWITGVRSRSR